LPAWAERGRARFRESLDDDLNISGALAALFDLVSAGNTALDGNAVSPGEASAALALLDELDQVAGFLRRAEERADDETAAMAELREQARKARNWAEADRLREELLARGWAVQDTPRGPRLKKK
jgi:cysteinyl-tRNA synthetase